MRPRSSRPSRLLVPAVVGAAAALVVLAAAVEGAPRFEPRFGLGEASRTPPPAPTSTPSAQAAGPSSGVVELVLQILMALVGLAVAVLLILLLARVIRGRVRRLPPAVLAAPPTEGLTAAVPEEADAPVVRRGIAAALAALDEGREPADAVVRAWLGLQQSAEDAGVPRGAAETPTEFAVRVLARTGADERAVRSLLGLYLAARFADAPVTPGDADAARTALTDLQRSWAGERVP